MTSSPAPIPERQHREVQACGARAYSNGVRDPGKVREGRFELGQTRAQAELR